MRVHASEVVYDLKESELGERLALLAVYAFSLFHYPKKDYYFTYDTSIISLIFININYCYYCYYHTII